MSEKMQPLIVLPTGQVSKADIARLRANGLCVIEAKDPASVRFAEPYPQGYSIQEYAAIELARILLRDGVIGTCNHRKAIGSMYADILIAGWPPKHIEPVKP